MAATHFYGAEFFGGEFFFGLIEILDTHDGDIRRRRKQREARERLREQIRRALDGPEAPVLQPALERLATPGPEPLDARVELGELLAQVELWRAVRLAARAWARARNDEDDEDVIALITSP